MEADVAKGRRDWAFSERDKVVLERESIRTLCDKLRRERDRYVTFHEQQEYGYGFSSLPLATRTSADVSE